MPGRETLARDHNVCPPPQSTHNFPTWLYVFSRWFRFWLKNKVLTGMRSYLLPWEQGWMKTFHGSAAASSPLAHVRAWTCSLWVNVYGERGRPRLCRGAAPHVGVARARGELLPRALRLSGRILCFTLKGQSGSENGSVPKRLFQAGC